MSTRFVRVMGVVIVLSVSACSDDGDVSTSPVTTEATTSASAAGSTDSAATTAPTTAPPSTAPASTAPTAPTTAPMPTSPLPPSATTTTTGPTTTTVPPTTAPTTVPPPTGSPSTIDGAGGVQQPGSFRSLQASVAVKSRCDSNGFTVITVTATATGDATHLEIFLTGVGVLTTKFPTTGTFEFNLECPTPKTYNAVVTAWYPDGDSRTSVLPFNPF